MTLSPEGSPAKTYRLPGAVLAWPENAAAYGQSSPALLGRYDHGSHSLKTAQLSLAEGLTVSSPILPRWGWMRDGVCWGLMTQALRTNGSVSGFWASPNATDAKPVTGGVLHQTASGTVRARNPDGSSSQRGLVEQVRWPTPNAPNGGRGIAHAERVGNSFYHRGKKVQFGLEAAVKQWPTPTRSDGTGGPGNQGRAGGENLRTAAAGYPTPTARDWRSGGASPATMARNSRPLSEHVTGWQPGGLNPAWVEWLMGWPLGWTDPTPGACGHPIRQTRAAWVARREACRVVLPASKPWATGRCRRWRRLRGAY